MDKRFLIPDFQGSNTVKNVCERIDAILAEVGALRIRAHHSSSGTSFSFPADTASQKLLQLEALLAPLHPNIRIKALK